MLNFNKKIVFKAICNNANHNNILIDFVRKSAYEKIFYDFVVTLISMVIT